VRQLFLVILGSGFGGGARYLVSGWFVRGFGLAFPFGTIAINVIGSLLIGIVMHVGLNTNLMSADMRVALTTGILGGFTTYSTFNYETVSFFQQGALLLGMLNVFVTVFVCLLAGVGGLLIGRWLIPI
jgi:CrcB protein